MHSKARWQNTFVGGNAHAEEGVGGRDVGREPLDREVVDGVSSAGNFEPPDKCGFRRRIWL